MVALTLLHGLAQGVYITRLGLALLGNWKLSFSRLMGVRNEPLRQNDCVQA